MGCDFGNLQDRDSHRKLNFENIFLLFIQASKQPSLHGCDEKRFENAQSRENRQKSRNEEIQISSDHAKRSCISKYLVLSTYQASPESQLKISYIHHISSLVIQCDSKYSRENRRWSASLKNTQSTESSAKSIDSCMRMQNVFSIASACTRISIATLFSNYTHTQRSELENVASKSRAEGGIE